MGFNRHLEPSYELGMRFMVRPLAAMASLPDEQIFDAVRQVAMGRDDARAVLAELEDWASADARAQIAAAGAAPYIWRAAKHWLPELGIPALASEIASDAERRAHFLKLSATMVERLAVEDAITAASEAAAAAAARRVAEQLRGLLLSCKETSHD